VLGRGLELGHGASVSLKTIIEEFEDGLYRDRYLREERACLDVAIHIAATAGEHGCSDPPTMRLHYLRDFTGIVRTFAREENSDDVRRAQRASF
jgi:hypothetical protein